MWLLLKIRCLWENFQASVELLSTFDDQNLKISKKWNLPVSLNLNLLSDNDWRFPVLKQIVLWLNWKKYIEKARWNKLRYIMAIKYNFAYHFSLPASSFCAHEQWCRQIEIIPPKISRPSIWCYIECVCSFNHYFIRILFKFVECKINWIDLS